MSTQEVLNSLIGAQLGVLSDKNIVEYVKHTNMITPFVSKKEKFQGISYGLEPCGYTATLSSDYALYRQQDSPIDPSDPKMAKPIGASAHDKIFFKRGQHIIASTVEEFNFPEGVCGFIQLKSTYSRLGIVGSFASIEPGYKGVLSLNLYNGGANDILLVVGGGIVQVHFVKTTSKGAYDGKYNSTTVEGAKSE